MFDIIQFYKTASFFRDVQSGGTDKFVHDNNLMHCHR